MDRSCFSNLNILLTKIGDTKGIELLKERWETCDQIGDNDVKGISSEEFKDIVEELTYSVKVCVSLASFSFLSFFFSSFLVHLTDDSNRLETSTKTDTTWSCER